MLLVLALEQLPLVFALGAAPVQAGQRAQLLRVEARRQLFEERGVPDQALVLLLSTFITMSVFSSGGKRTRSARSKPSCSRSTRRLVLSMNSSTCGYLSM